MKRLLEWLQLFRLDGRISWITHVVMGVGLGCASILLYLAALVQQGTT